MPEIKLNLGSGSRYKESYVNADLYAEKVDQRLDLREKLPYSDNEVNEIYASHLIEHFTRLEWKKIKKDWFRVLKPNGLLHILCPDLEQICKGFLEKKEIRWCIESNEMSWIEMIYGGQEPYGKGEEHKNGFTMDKLKKDLEEEGFVNFEEKFNPNELELKCRKPQL